MNTLQIVTFIFNSRLDTSNKELSNFYDRFKFKNRENIHSTMSADCLNVPAYRTNIRKFCIKCNGPLLWNSIPRHITSVTSVYCLKLEFKKFVRSSYS